MVMIEDKRLRPGRQLSRYGGFGVDRKLPNRNTTPAVFWSEGHNSYVAVLDPDGFYRIISINGVGEIRWKHKLSDTWMDADTQSAVAYFFE